MVKRLSKRAVIGGVGAAIIAAAFVITIQNGYWRKGSEQTVQPTLGQTYHNSLTLAEEWPDYGIGDPYVLRYNGKYYLYCSTKDFRVGVKAWSSDDLIQWKYEGLVTEEPLTEGAYAPEVIYWNGYFYMYTSPAGKGHYVLRSEKPTGPFTVETDNLGLTIDGSVFIDDDTKMYFTRAEFGGITGHEMASPLEIDPAGTKLNASLGHWTEGSMIIKRNGRYYMTYTGNHVFSKGYRINYAVAKDSPLGQYTVPENNPIVISTDKDFNGLGHSATVMGPDMDSYYMVYHNLIGHSAEGPPVRMLNMDRLVFNGDKMALLGPTHYPVPVPKLPAFHDSLGGASVPSALKWDVSALANKETVWLSKPDAGGSGRFTAEFNFSLPLAKAAGEAAFATVFSYSADGQSYRAVRVDAAAQQLVLEEAASGKSRAGKSAALPQGTDLSKLHTIRVESSEMGTLVYWDGLLLMEDNRLQAQPGRIGYAFAGIEPDLQFTAFANDAGGSSDFEAFKTLPGTIEAVHYLTGKDRGYHIDDEPADHAVYRPEDGVAITDAEDGSYEVTLSAKGDWLNYAVNIGAEGNYLFALMAEKSSAEAIVELSVDGESGRFTLAGDQFAEEASATKIPLGQLKLAAGAHTLRVKLVKGELKFRYVEGSLAAGGVEQTDDLLEKLEPDDSYGDWTAQVDGSYAFQTEDKDSKLFMGNNKWTDYQLSFDITQKSKETLGEGAVLFRITNESDFPDQVADSFMGYELAFRNDRVVLKRINYERNDEVASESLVLKAGQPSRLSVEVKGNVISVFAGEKSDKPLLQWRDPNAFLHGRVGLRSSSSDWQFAKVSIMDLK